MKNLSSKRRYIESRLSAIKKSLPNVCCICHCYTSSPQLMHLLPRSLYPEYITEKWNLAIGCPYCHDKYDNDKSFRKKQTKIINIIKQHDPLAANRYFDL